MLPFFFRIVNAELQTRFFAEGRNFLKSNCVQDFFLSVCMLINADKWTPEKLITHRYKCIGTSPSICRRIIWWHLNWNLQLPPLHTYPIMSTPLFPPLCKNRGKPKWRKGIFITLLFLSPITNYWSFFGSISSTVVIHFWQLQNIFTWNGSIVCAFITAVLAASANLYYCNLSKCCQNTTYQAITFCSQQKKIKR